MQLKQQQKLGQNPQSSGIEMRKIIQSLMKGQIETPTNQVLINVWTSLKIAIGSLLIRGYRMFKYMLEQECIIFIKRQAYHTRYLYFKIAFESEQLLAPNFISAFNYCINSVNKFKRNDNQTYSIFILYSQNYITLQINSCPELNQILVENKPCTSGELKQKIGMENIIQDNFSLLYVDDEIKIGKTQNQHKKLKQIVYSYIDTFGQKLKTNYYKQLTKKSLFIINTVNLIIFEQTKPCKKPAQCTPVYNQIQSASWTFFKGKMQSDRKDIVLCGNGRILFIDLVFLDNLNDYIDTRYEEEVDSLIFQCKKAYLQAKVKVIKLQKTLIRNVHYSYQQKMIDSYSKVPIVS